VEICTKLKNIGLIVGGRIKNVVGIDGINVDTKK
jgi:hypothetical protein